MSPRKRLLCYLALASVVVMVLMGCSSPSSSSGGGATDASASKSPLKVLIITVLSNPAFSDPEAAVAAKAYVKQVNAAGGIHGHPIDVEVCDSNLDPNKETACFQQAVTDHVVAVVGSFLAFGTGLKLLQSAGIPFIGGNGTTLAEFTSPVSFPADSGELGWFEGEAALIKGIGATKPVMMACDSAPCALAFQIAQGYWTRSGGGTVRQVVAPLADPQYTAQAASVAAGGTNGVMMAAPTQEIPKMVTDVRQANYTGPIVLEDSFVNSSTVTAMGPYADGLLVAGLLDPVTETSSPGVKAFVSGMNAEDPSALKDGIAEHTWNGFDLFTQVAETIPGDVTAASLMTAMENVKTPITLGLSGSWVSPTSATAPDRAYLRLSKYTLTYIPEKIENGELVATGPRTLLGA